MINFIQIVKLYRKSSIFLKYQFFLKEMLKIIDDFCKIYNILLKITVDFLQNIQYFKILSIFYK